MFNRKFLWFTLLASVLLVLSACNGDTSDEEEVDEEDTATAEEVEALFLSGDIVSEQGGCVLSSQFVSGDKIIFRMNVVDGNGEQVEDADLKVHLSTGEELEMAYGPHGNDHFWVVAYPVTEDTPTGQLEYHVTAEYDDLETEWKPFDVGPSLLTILEAEETEEVEEDAA